MSGSGWRGYDERPPWWPESEPFPPPGRRHGTRTGLPRRFVLMFFVFMLLALIGLLAALSALAGALGIVRPSDSPGGSGLTGLIVVVLIILALSIARRTFRRIAGPVGGLIEAAGRVEAGDYNARVREHGGPELRSLARAFNAMTSRLEMNESQRKQLLADVTHELRTPLTVLQGNIEALLDGVRPLDRDHIVPLLDETRVLSRLVDDLRTLSLAEAGALTLHREPTALDTIARDVCTTFAGQAAESGVSLLTTGRANADADPIRLREVIANLVANALRYTPAGGSIAIDLRTTGGTAEVVVRDTGRGIAQEALGSIFERFSKSTDSPGAGLGLAIAKGLVVAHGGEIRAESEPGQGTRIVFTLPGTISPSK